MATTAFDNLYTAKEAVHILRVSRSTLHQFVTSGALRATRLGGAVLRFKEDDIKAFIEAGAKATPLRPDAEKRGRGRPRKVPLQPPVAADDVV